MNLTFRRALPSDERIFWDWANDPQTRENAFSSGPIPWEEHRKWFAAKTASPDCAMFIFSMNEIPVAQVRFDRTDGEVLIDVSVAPDRRGSGVGKAALTASAKEIEMAWPGSRLVGLVKSSNHASARLFETCGFEETVFSRDGVRRFERRVS